MTAHSPASGPCGTRPKPTAARGSAASSKPPGKPLAWTFTVRDSSEQPKILHSGQEDGQLNKRNPAPRNAALPSWARQHTSGDKRGLLLPAGVPSPHPPSPHEHNCSGPRKTRTPPRQQSSTEIRDRQPNTPLRGSGLRLVPDDQPKEGATSGLRTASPSSWETREGEGLGRRGHRPGH